MPEFTVVRTDHTFVDAEGVTIHYYRWSPGKPRGVVQLAHGVGEYAARYEGLAQALVAAGYRVYADDHRGHGQTGLKQWSGDHSRLGKLGPGGLRAAIAAIQQLTRIIKAENPGMPLAYLGHSWGSLMGQKIINADIASYDALILTGTAYRMPGSMNSGDLNKGHAALGTTGYEWLSRDPLVSQAFLEDPLAFTADIIKLFGLADGLRLFGLPKRNLEKDVPLLIMVGGDDSLGGAKSAEKLAESYRTRGGLSDVEVKVYPDARHEIFNELNKTEVISDLLSWLSTHLPAPAK